MGIRGLKSQIEEQLKRRASPLPRGSDRKYQAYQKTIQKDQLL